MTPIPTPETGGMGHHNFEWSRLAVCDPSLLCRRAMRIRRCHGELCLCPSTRNVARQLLDQTAEVPTTFDVLSVMIYGGLGHYSRETSLVFSAAVEEWPRELQSGADKPEIDIYSIDVNLSDVGDLALRDKVLAIPTSFRISDEDRSLLKVAARANLTQNPELRRFLESTKPR